MKRSVLVIAPYIPLPANFGGALRIYHLIRQLARHYDVSLLAPGNADEMSYAFELGQKCDVTVVPGATQARRPASRRKRMEQMRSLLLSSSYLQASAFNPRMQSALDRILMTRRIDLVQYEFPESALYRVPPTIATLFDAHNVEHDLLARVARTSSTTGKRVFNMHEARKLKRLELEIWDRSTLCIATSERDANLMRGLTSTPVDVVPNGVDLTHFATAPLADATPASVVFTGAMRHQPNADGARWYVEQVHARVQDMLPATHITIVGADPPASVQALASESVSVTGRVDDVSPYLRQSNVVVVPLFSGGGTRLKILEAFASGRPVVSTSLGAEGLQVCDGEHILLADDASGFADAVVRLAQDRDLATRLTASARQLVEQHYGWETIAAKLMQAHERAIELHTG